MHELNLFPLFLSLRVALTATLLCTVAGLSLAVFISRQNRITAAILDTLATLPAVLPPTVTGYYLLLLLGRGSFIGKFMEQRFNTMLVFTPTAAVIAASVVALPQVVKYSRVAFDAIDREYVYAARLLGRSEWSIFITIVLPLSWPALCAGISLCFARALGDFGTTLMLAGSIPGQTVTMPIAIYNALQAGDTSMANVLVGIMTGVSLLTLFVVNRLEKVTRQG